MACNIISCLIIIIILLLSKNKHDEIKCSHGEKCFLPFMPFLEVLSGIIHALPQHNWEYVVVPPHLLSLCLLHASLLSKIKEFFISIFTNKRRKIEKKILL